MREATHDLLRQMAGSIAALTAMAEEQAALADRLIGQPVADVIRDIARSHRLRACELRADLAALEALRSPTPTGESSGPTGAGRASQKPPSAKGVAAHT